MVKSKYTALPKHCQQCGSPMVAGQRKKANNSFDVETGHYNGRVQYSYKCKRIVGFHPIDFFRWHDRFLVTDTPNDPITDSPHRSIQRMAY